MVSWKEQQKAIEDIQQCTLNPDLTINKNTHIIAEQQPNIKYDDIVLCPFCLTSNQLYYFNIRKGLRVCPKCGSNLKLSTLSKIKNLDSFVDFVFGYRFSGFWDKICMDITPKTKDDRFNEWNKRLKELGLSYDFWEKYKLLKGDFGDNE